MIEVVIPLILGVFAIGLLIPAGEATYAMRRLGSRMAYAVFVGVLGFSPIFGWMFADIAGIRSDPSAAFSFLWVGVVASLPMSLLIARAFGQAAYHGYWTYLEGSSRSSKRRIVAVWAVASAIAFLAGLSAHLFGEAWSY